LWLPIAFVLFIGIGWGATFPLTRLARIEGIPFISVVFWQCLGAALVLLLIAAPLRALPKLSPRHLKAYLVLSGVAVVIPLTVLSIVAPKVPAGVLGLVQTLEPMMTYLLVLILAMESFRSLRAAGLLFGLAGVLLILVPEASLPSPDMAGWIALGLIIPLGWALWSVLAVLLRPPQTPSLPYAIGMFGAASLLLLPVMAATGSWWFFEGPFGSGDWALVGIVFINAAVSVASFECVRLFGPVVYSMWGYVGTLTSAGIGIVLFGERHSLWIWIALALLFAGLTLVTRGGDRGRKATAQ
jgi:drug/metabolite transporter (DMT)-like permease